MLRFGLTVMFSLYVLSLTACGSGGDDGPASNADPDNCSFPCIQTSPVFDKTTVVSATGDTVTMTLVIDGDASIIDISGTYLRLNPVNAAGGQGTLVFASSEVVDINANTLTANFIIPAGTVTGEFYPKLDIAVAFTPDPNDPGTGLDNSVTYELDSDNSSTNYSYSEHIDGEGSTYTSNGVYLGTVITDIVIPVITLQ